MFLFDKNYIVPMFVHVNRLDELYNINNKYRYIIRYMELEFLKYVLCIKREFNISLSIITLDVSDYVRS